MNQEWNIKARNDQCGMCNKPFADREEFYSRLTFDGAEGYLRTDYCATCWSDPARQGALSIWKSVFEVPAPPTPDALRKETAESMLRQMMETEDLSKRNAIFILAVMLERKRILAEKDVQTREDGLKIRVYEHKKTGETFLVLDPGLKLSELKHVQEEVVALLGGGTTADAAAVAEAAEAVASPDQDAGS